MSSILKYEGLKYEKGSASKVADPLTVERALQIDINGNSFTVVMQTPGNEMELARGLLFAEDVIKKNTAIQFEIKKKDGDIIQELNVLINEKDIGKGYLNSRSLLSVSSCGICGKLELEDLKVEGDKIKEGDSISTQEIFKFQEEMMDKQIEYHQTGGSHAAAVYNHEGKMLALREDIGRHNAIDKIIGKLIEEGNLTEAKVVSFSGRLSYEIVSKCFRAKIPIIIAVSAPSSLAIDFAKEYGMTLIAFCRNSRATCYANSWRIID